jgi:hypothetical protein
MKATLEFQLPEDQAEFTAATQGQQAKAALWDIAQHCRGVLKHGEPSKELEHHIRLIRDMIDLELLND